VSGWWEHGYAGGPMVELPGFPRPLYPPDANEHGKKASAPGPDVEAYKRTVSRAGRWPWQDFDDAYSNGFAHGTSGNVGETGVAGVQRQQDIDDTGWLGKNTFNTLRSIRVPQGPHEGEMAMDAYAADLLREAWELYGGHEPAAGGSAALSRAIGELGVKESPANTNNVKYCDWYGMVGPWCAMFVTWCYEHSGGAEAFIRGQRYAYVPYLVSDAYAGRYGLRVTSEPKPGDCVCYSWDFDSEYDHIGLFEEWKQGSTFSAIEGNTSTSSDSDGGQVMRRTRDTWAQATLFVSVG
jgi:CHAP domain